MPPTSARGGITVESSGNIEALVGEKKQTKTKKSCKDTNGK